MFAVSDIETLLEDLDTSNVTNMEGMFFECKNLKNIPPLNTSSDK